MIGRLAAALALSVAAEAQAGEMPRTALFAMGFVEARASDFAGAPGQARRRADPSGGLAVTADFNGDGTPDEARVLINREQDRAYVVATILTAKLDTYVLAQMTLMEAAGTGIRLAPGSVSHLRTKLSGITTYKLDGSAEQRDYFDGEEFSTAPTREPSQH